MTTMRALQLVSAGSPVQLREVPIPDVKPREVLVRVRAAGICHSDAHYRSGRSRVEPLPLTLGHEVCGDVARVGRDVSLVREGDRVALHYLIACGDCLQCSRGHEQFCSTGSMLGHFRDGGWADYIVVPERNAVRIPSELSYAQGAVLMCSAATSLHALRRGRLSGGETVAVFGVGGLGMSAIQLARALGALDVYAIDLDANKLARARELGAIPVNAADGDAAEMVRALTNGRGVDVSLELIGLPLTIEQSLRALAVHGRAVIAGLSSQSVAINVYRDLLGREAELLGANDHLLQELPGLIEFARRRLLDLEHVVQQTVPLESVAVNQVLDSLDSFQSPVRTVIVP